MAYNLIITKRAEELLDDLIYQLINRYKNEDATKRLLNHIGCIHDRLIDNPYQFPLIRDRYLSMQGYRIAIIPKTKYILVFDIREDIVFVLGIFHQLENYGNPQLDRVD